MIWIRLQSVLLLLTCIQGTWGWLSKQCRTLPHLTHIQGRLLFLFCSGLRSIFSLVYFHMLSQENKIMMIHTVMKYQQKWRIKSEGLDPTPSLCQIKWLSTHYFPLVNSEIIILLELIYLIIINEMIFRSTDVCIDFGCKCLQAAERRAFLVSCVCTERLQMAWVIQEQRSRNGSDLARGTVISKPPARYWTLQPLWLGCLPFGQDKALDTPYSTLSWTRVFGISSGRVVGTTRCNSSGLLELHLRGMKVESLLISSSLTSAWYFLAVVSVWFSVGHFREFDTCMSGKCNGIYAPNSQLFLQIPSQTYAQHPALFPQQAS